MGKKKEVKRSKFVEGLAILNICLGSIAIGTHLGSDHYIIMSVLALIVTYEYITLYNRWSKLR